MAELNLPVYDFRHGILTPKLKDRPNLDLYKSGVLVGENFLTQIHGPTEYRPGFEHIRTTRRNNIAHFIPFTFADDEAHILSFTEGFMRVFTDGGVVTENPLAISGITQDNPGVVTVVGHDFVDGDEIFIEGVIGMTDLNGQFFLVAGAVVPGTSEMNWPYSTPGNYTFNGADVEVTAGVAKLVSAGSSSNFPFTTPANYTFDTDVMEVDGEASLTGIGLLAYGHWKLDESSGTNAPDSSGNSRDGTTNNMDDADWVAAKVDNGLIFDGVNDWLDLGDIANFERTDSFSFEFWFKTATAGAELIFTRQLNAGTFRGWNVFIENGNITTALISDNGSVNRIQRKTNGTFNDNVFHHCVITYDGTSTVAGLVIHIDDSAVATTVVTDNLSATILNAASCQISGRDGANVVFTGTIDEAVIYTKVLSGAEITARFNSGSGTNLMQYSLDNPKIVNNTGFVFVSVLNVFVESATKPGSDEIQYQVSSDDGTTWEYWDGAAWDTITAAQTDTFYFDNESNTAAVIQTNIGTLAASGTLKFRAFLHSDDGTTTPELDNILVADASFPLTDPTIESDQTFVFTAALEDFTETATKPANTEIQYIVSIDGGSTFLWWSGAAWVASDGTFAESNLASVVDTNIAALGASGTFTYKAFLHTSDSAATPLLNNIHSQFTVLASDTFKITDQDGNLIDTTTFDAYISNGTAAKVFEIVSPYETADLPQLKFAQKSDIMYIDHPRYLPRKITRFGDGTWTLEIYTRTEDPFDQKPITDITQANPGVVSSTAHGYVNGELVLIEDVKGMVEANHVVYTITKINDDSYSIGVDTTAFTAYASGGASIIDGLAPATCGFFGGRLFHGGSDIDPDFMEGSRSPDTSTGATRYQDHTLGPNPDDAISFALASASTSTTDRIRFFMGTRQFLAVGTFAGMLKVNGGSDATPISSLDIESFPIDNFGVADIMPVQFGTAIIYVQRGSEVVYSFKFTLLSDGFESEDETIQSDEITDGGIVQIAYQQGDPNKVWAAMEDGRLLSFVFNNKESVSAWNEHLVAGDGKVLSVAAQPQLDNIDRVWIAVERVINGVTRRYVEYLSKNPRIPERDDFYTGSDTTALEADDAKYRNLLFFAQKRQIHLDSALALDTTQSLTITPAAITGDSVSFVASASMFSASDLLRKIQIKHITGLEVGIAKIVEFVSETEVLCQIQQDFASTDTIPGGEWYFTQDTVAGLTHLEGETVSVVADGGIHPDRVVVNGAITLVGQATYVMVGLFYFGRVKTMPLELLLTTGITPGRFKTVNKINLMFRNTLGVSYGTDPYNMQRIGFRDGPQFTGRPTFLFNGVKEQPGFDHYAEQRSMWIVQTVPYPCTLNSIVFDMEVSGEN